MQTLTAADLKFENYTIIIQILTEIYVVSLARANEDAPDKLHLVDSLSIVSFWTMFCEIASTKK